jgi:hypothetical protein
MLRSSLLLPTPGSLLEAPRQRYPKLAPIWSERLGRQFYFQTVEFSRLVPQATQRYTVRHLVRPSRALGPLVRRCRTEMETRCFRWMHLAVCCLMARYCFARVPPRRANIRHRLLFSNTILHLVPSRRSQVPTMQTAPATQGGCSFCPAGKCCSQTGQMLSRSTRRTVLPKQLGSRRSPKHQAVSAPARLTRCRVVN